jgi:phosphatidylglycerol:prolipoprotein diacylglycerol transferase
MSPFVLLFPQIDPVAVQLGPFGIRWYALSYIAGILLAWRTVIWLSRRPPDLVSRQDIDDFVMWATLGIVLGGRLGYVLFYRPLFYFTHPQDLIAVWQGGMSFHGGMLGVALAIILFCRLRRLSILGFADMLSIVAPIGLGLVRIANFINGELWGRVSDVPWAMVFPGGGADPRHPSQLYQAGMEGLILFLVMITLEFRGLRRTPGRITGVFLLGYGIARSVGEQFREPDSFMGYLAGGLTMGVVLSLPMILAGLGLLLWPRRSTA